MRAAMHKDTERKPAIIEAYVDPLEPLVPPKAKSEYIQKISESFAKGQPYSDRIGLTRYRNKFQAI
jgi:pyruvate dehydrogenase (quinone)